MTAQRKIAEDENTTGEKLYKLTARGDSGMTIERDDDLAYLRSQKRRYEGMGMTCRIEEDTP
jgi:hypothetical protein